MKSYFFKSEFYKKAIEVTDINGEIIVIVTDNKDREVIFSWYDIVWKMTKSNYINQCLLGSFLKKIPENVLIIGFGGGAFARYLEDHILDEIKITGIEIDEAMIDISKEIIGVKTNDLYIKDAIFAMDEIIEKKLKYESILLDVYASNGEIPDYFLSLDFISKLKQVLTETGTISINFANGDFSPDLLSRYKAFHKMMISNFGPYFNILQAGKDDFGNISVIYNLDKVYYEADFLNNYLKNAKAEKIIYDEFIIKNIFLCDDYLN